MKINPVSVRKVALLATICGVMLVSVTQVSAERVPMPLEGIPAVPDSGATVMLLGAAFGALGMARRFLRKP